MLTRKFTRSQLPALTLARSTFGLHSIPSRQYAWYTPNPATNERLRYMLRRTAKTMLYIIVGITAVIGANATISQYKVENILLAPEADEQVRQWQWDEDVDRWNGDSARGGTDPGLGLRLRHNLRTVLSLHPANVISEHDTAHEDHFTENAPDMLRMLHSVNVAAQRLHSAGQIHPDTYPQLLLREAEFLEQLGGDDTQAAKELCITVWDMRKAGSDPGASNLDMASLAQKLANISLRLEKHDEALLWWTRAIDLCADSAGGRQTKGSNISGAFSFWKFPGLTASQKIPASSAPLPSSPRAQRIYVSTLTSMVDFYVAQGDLSAARALSESILKHVRPAVTSVPLSSISAPETLHRLFMMRQSSRLYLQLAKIELAKHNSAVAIPALQQAIDMSERVVDALIGQPLIEDASVTIEQRNRPNFSDCPLSTFTTSRAMRIPSVGLLWDSRRTAAEAWNTLGKLCEEGDNRNVDDLKAAIQFYGRAAALTGPTSTEKRALLEAWQKRPWGEEWRAYMRNYILTQSKLVAKGSRPTRKP